MNGNYFSYVFASIRQWALKSYLKQQFPLCWKIVASFPMISGVGGAVTLKETGRHGKVTDSKGHWLKTASTTDVRVEIMDCHVIVWYSVEIISTVAHLAQTVSSQGLYFYCWEKCIKTCCPSIITTVITLIKHELHAGRAFTPVDFFFFLPLQHKVALCWYIKKKKKTATKMSAFVTRSILLFAAKALKI